MKRSDEWVKWSYKQYLEDARTVAKAFIKLGLARHHAVGIVGFNAPEWFIAQAGAIFAGGISCGVYTTNSPQESVQQSHFGSRFAFWHFNLPIEMQIGTQMASHSLFENHLEHLKIEDSN